MIRITRMVSMFISEMIPQTEQMFKTSYKRFFEENGCSVPETTKKPQGGAMVKARGGFRDKRKVYVVGLFHQRMNKFRTTI
jgi:hypothetical protein